MFFKSFLVLFFWLSSDNSNKIFNIFTTASSNRQNGKTSEKKFILLFLDFGHLKCPNPEKLQQIFLKLVLPFLPIFHVFYF